MFMYVEIVSKNLGRSYHEEFYPPKVPGIDDVRQLSI